MANNGWNEDIARDPFARLTNPEIEQALLGALLIENRAFEHVADVVASEDFGNGVHGRIFAAIGKMIERGQAANPSTMRAIFEQDSALENVGGVGYLGSLARNAVSVLNSRDYAQQIADLARRRDLVSASQDTIADASIVDPARTSDVVLDEAEERLYRIGEGRSNAGGPTKLSDILTATIGKIETAYKAGGAITIDTGLLDVDRIVSGMGAGDLCVLAGRPSMGKSAMAGTIAYNAAVKGKRVLIFSLEMSREEIAQRWIAGMTGIPTDRQRHGSLNPEEWAKLAEAQGELGALPILVDDQARLSVAQMRQRARRARRRAGLDLVIVDHLQLVRQGGKHESRRLEIGDATSALKAIAKELGVPVLLLSQLSRAPEQREDKRPALSDLRESGDIEQDADVVMLLYREEYYLERTEPKHTFREGRDAFAAKYADWEDRRRQVRGLAEINIAKNRHGRTGVAKALFVAERQRFDNLEVRAVG